MEHNAIISLFLLGASGMFITVQYSKVALGPSGKGKTTALLSELSLFGGQKKFFY